MSAATSARSQLGSEADDSAGIDAPDMAGYVVAMSKNDVRDAALSLPPKERASLAHDLLRSLEGSPDPESETAWIVEIERRARELASGVSLPVDWKEARDRIERRLRERGR